MSALEQDEPFVAQLRARATPIVIAGDGGSAISVRVQVPEVWDVVLVQVPAGEPVVSVKSRALAALVPDAESHEDYIVKLNGFEVLDEHVSLDEAGARDGSTFLVTHRRRRPVR